MGVKLLFFMVLAAVMRSLLALEIVSPGTLYISEMGFQQQLECKDESQNIVGCNIQIIGLPEWMTLEDNTLKLVAAPSKDSIERIIIVGSSGDERASRIIVLYIDYNYQQTRLSDQTNTITKTETITTDDLTTTRETETKEDATQDEIIIETESTSITIQSPQEQVSQPTEEEKEALKKKYQELLNRQSKAHERVAYFLTQLAIQKQQMNILGQTIETLLTEQKQIRIHLDILIREVEIWRNNLDSTKKSLNQEKSSLQNINQQIDNITAVISKNQAQLNNTKTIIANIKQEMEKINSEIELMESQMGQLKIRLAQYQQLCARVSSEAQKMQSEIQAEKEKQAEAESRIGDLEKKSQKYSQDIEALRRQLERLEREKQQTDASLQTQRSNLGQIQQGIKEKEQSEARISSECDSNVQTQLQGLIDQLQGAILSEIQKRREMNSQLNLEERRANSNSQNSESLRIQLERVTSNKNRIEQIVSNLNHEISDIETKIYRISVEINQTQEELTSIEKQIVISSTNQTGVEERLKHLNEELQAALIEKQLVDGQIKKVLLGENTIIHELGFSQIFYARTNVPEGFNDITSIQNELQSSNQLYEIGLLPGRNLKQQQWQQCEGMDEAASYGSGYIEKLENNEFTVRSSNGQVSKLKIFTCSLNLSPIQDYIPKVGDLMCWRAFNYEDYEVIIESLVFRV